MNDLPTVAELENQGAEIGPFGAGDVGYILGGNVYVVEAAPPGDDAAPTVVYGGKPYPEDLKAAGIKPALAGRAPNVPAGPDYEAAAIAGNPVD